MVAGSFLTATLGCYARPAWCIYVCANPILACVWDRNAKRTGCSRYGCFRDQACAQVPIYRQHIRSGSHHVTDGVHHPSGARHHPFGRLYKWPQVIAGTIHEAVHGERDRLQVSSSLLNRRLSGHRGKLGCLCVEMLRHQARKDLLVFRELLHEWKRHLCCCEVGEQSTTSRQLGQLQNRIVAVRKAKIEQIADAKGLENRVSTLMGRPRRRGLLAALPRNVERHGRPKAGHDRDDAISRIQARRDP
ncbi:MAG TPA: hypothetical protein DFR83_15000 [Deltaproteobacteria bacterium]|nr:hypothetical protein [Deltaproteobacteria bacterium]